MTNKMQDLGSTSRWLGFEPDIIEGLMEIEGLIGLVEKEIADLIQNKLLSEEKMYLLQIGRKAAHLLKDFGDLPEMGFPLHFTKVLYKKEILIYTDPKLPENSNIIIFADTIHKGREMIIVLKSFVDKNINVNKIYCYLKNVEGYKNIIEKGLFNEDNIISIHESHSEEEYNELGIPLRIFNRSRIKPMDLDICYNEYRVINDIDLNTLETFIASILLELFDIKKDELLIDENKITSNVHEIRYDFENIDKIKRELTSIFINNDAYDISSISMRIKILKRERRDNFIISVLIESNMDQNICAERGSNLIEHKCLIDSIETKISEDRIRPVICPHCVNSHIANYIIGQINESLDGHELAEDTIIGLWSPYRPSDYQKLFQDNEARAE